ncbi:SIMPL domain-containing protein [Aliikangiella sp. IMCC44359]|uniref:SIMPL domain-containing protein n=1 Tax=Aliikangiella sp. IMCC44359 TaxID=3459125 RepID=UPI00403AE3E2
MEKNNQVGIVLLGVFLACGLATSGYFIGQTMFNAKVALNTAEAKGLAERRVEANRANWSISFSVVGQTKEEIPSLYDKSEKQQNIIIDLLKKNGFDDTEIEVGVLNYENREFRDENQKVVDQKHYLTGSINIETEKVRLVSSVRIKVNKLIAQGIDVKNHAPAYRFTLLNEIKPDMLKEATKNARIAANEFAENAGVKVGGIRSARQGSFYVRDAGQDYGDTKRIEKDVRVVTNITFYLTD